MAELLAAWSGGDRTALDRLLPLVYGELRRVAARRLARERPGHTLQPTALVHEAYLKLVDQRSARWESRTQFFGVAAELMRRILVDHARARAASKRGAGKTLLSLDAAGEPAGPSGPNADLLTLDAALQRLALLDERQGRIVELRYFGGLSIDETALVLQLSPATVKRGWTMARAWLFRELGGIE
jgi:RNA polymerase sigma factor (TIGR02999 family)